MAFKFAELAIACIFLPQLHFGCLYRKAVTSSIVGTVGALQAPPKVTASSPSLWGAQEGLDLLASNTKGNSDLYMYVSVSAWKL